MEKKIIRVEPFSTYAEAQGSDQSCRDIRRPRLRVADAPLRPHYWRGSEIPGS
jgi:hypothetical protein